MPWGVPESVIDQAAERLGLTAVTDAYLTNGGTLVIISGAQHYQIPLPAEGKTDTLPRGSSPPASTSPGGSPGPSGPEPPSEDTIKPDAASRKSEGLDDFTAIDGVGPTYAQALHNAGLYTYDDLREWPEVLDDLLPEHTRVKMARWLDQRLL
jgi:hypothetical protein